MKRSSLIVITVVVVLILMSALIFGNRQKTSAPGNDDSDTSNVTTPEQATNPIKPAETNTVSIKDMVFLPTHISVKKGTRVTWTNGDPKDHTVTSDDDSKTVFDSGTLTTGKTFLFTFSETGTFTYHCNFHLDMAGSVTVTE